MTGGGVILCHNSEQYKARQCHNQLLDTSGGSVTVMVTVNVAFLLKSQVTVKKLTLCHIIDSVFDTLS